MSPHDNDNQFGCRLVPPAILLMLLFAVPSPALCTMQSPPDSPSPSSDLLPESFLPSPGRSYIYLVNYPDGDSGTVTVIPALDERQGLLVCKTMIFSKLYQETIETTDRYQYLPDGIYLIEGDITTGMRWQNESGTHQIAALGVPCPVTALANEFCLQVTSRSDFMGDIVMESFFAQGYGEVLTRVVSSGTVLRILEKTSPLDQSQSR